MLKGLWILNIASIISIIGAFVIMALEKDGWGFLILAAILLAVFPSSTKNE